MQITEHKLAPPLAGVACLTVVLLFLGTDASGRNRLDPRSWAIESALESCPTYGEVAGDVRAGRTWGGDVVVDLVSCRDTARLIDPLHMLMQLGPKTRGVGYKVWLCHRGKTVFWMYRSDFDRLADKYADGERLPAFGAWPSILYAEGVGQAYREPEGMLGFIRRQSHALKRWVADVYEDE